MRRLLYVMHVDWRWIRQRPHFLACELGGHFDTRVAYCRYYRGRNLVANARDPGMAYSSLQRLPAALTRSRLGAAVNERLLSVQLRALLRRDRPDVVWLGSPGLFPAVARHLGDRQLVYDCMDDCAGFGSEEHRRQAVEAERTLLARADLVVVSSVRLAEVVASRGYARTPLLVFNGVAPHLLERDPAPRARRPEDPFVLCYFGTVGYWFDFDAMRAVLDRFPRAVLRIAGPCEVPIPAHPRIEYVGLLAHHELPALAAASDLLVMPFVVNDLIRGVDPVKVYEYISFRRNIVVPDYPGIRRFSPFVHRYASTAELLDTIERLMQDDRITYADADARRFLAENTWTSRAGQIVAALEGGERGGARAAAR